MTDAADQANFETISRWLTERGIVEVEVIVPDMNGIMRGKVVPAGKFLKGISESNLRIPSSVYVVSVTGDYPEDNSIAPFSDPDAVLRPDARTLRMAPGMKTPTAFVIVDGYTSSGDLIGLAPRSVLQRVLKLYADRDWQPVVAPELEFFLTRVNPDPDLPLEPPAGRSGRAETASQPYGMEAISEYEDLIDDIYDHCEKAELDIDTMIHESGAAQLEINFQHGDALSLADQVLLFKRIVRQLALKHGVYATFMAKPMEHQPGSAMHIHQSIIERESGRNLFATANGRDSVQFKRYIAGLQRMLPQLTLLYAPNVNSFRRMRPHFDAPINVQWGYDNRTCGLRVPISDAANRRVENRLPGADSNPYLAIASSLLAGYIGMIERMQPRAGIEGSAYRLARTLPRTLDEAIYRFSHCKPAKKFLGEEFVAAFTAIKETELDAYLAVISSWEREHLLLKV